ncbi:MAG TPA: HD domain-containing phosphohydrolase [Abditibacterium sp.]|jgi:putative two-component system response regulator
MNDADFYRAKFLIVDDEFANTRLLERHLTKWGYSQILSTNDPLMVATLYSQFDPDILLLDLMMPNLDGFQVMEQLKALIPTGDHVPILVLTANITPEAKRKALAAGAMDFLNKPFDATELSLRISNLLRTRFLHLQHQNRNVILEEMVAERTSALDQAQMEILERLAQAAEFRDDDTGQHTRRVGQLSSLLAQTIGLSRFQVELIERTAPLHDVGKIAIPDAILLKPGRLTAEEFEIMKTHTTIGATLLAGGHSDLVSMAQSIALTHHERWNGGGYPAGLQGEAIPIEGRIVAIVDVFDALTSERPYKEAWPVEKALEEIEQQSGKQFDPVLIEAFLQIKVGSKRHIAM